MAVEIRTISLLSVIATLFIVGLLLFYMIVYVPSPTLWIQATFVAALFAFNAAFGIFFTKYRRK